LGRTFRFRYLVSGIISRRQRQPAPLLKSRIRNIKDGPSPSARVSGTAAAVRYHSCKRLQRWPYGGKSRRKTSPCTSDGTPHAGLRVHAVAAHHPLRCVTDTAPPRTNHGDARHNCRSSPRPSRRRITRVTIYAHRRHGGKSSPNPVLVVIRRRTSQDKSRRTLKARVGIFRECLGQADRRKCRLAPNHTGTSTGVLTQRSSKGVGCRV
jgi:hypothetical protein